MRCGVGAIDWGRIAESGIQTAGTIFGPPTAPTASGETYPVPEYSPTTVQRQIDQLFGLQPVVPATQFQMPVYQAPSSGEFLGVPTNLLLIGAAALAVVWLVK